MQPEIAGPGANKIKVTVPTETEGIPSADINQLLNNLNETQKEDMIDPYFPFGRPENIDFTKLDSAGVTLIQELNIRPWIKTVEYCSGHPINRPETETSAYYPYITGEHVYDEIQALDSAFIRGLVPDVYFRYRKQELRQMGCTRFYLNTNVYDVNIFMDWTRVLSEMVLLTTQSVTNPVVVRFNPMRPGINYSIYWDYWVLEERDLIHMACLDALKVIPI